MSIHSVAILPIDDFRSYFWTLSFKSGISRRYILRPLIFSIFINNIRDSVSNSIYLLLADDLNITSYIRSVRVTFQSLIILCADW